MCEMPILAKQRHVNMETAFQRVASLTRDKTLFLLP